jgi:hypothetical protein
MSDDRMTSGAGRRLSAMELARVAAEMGLAISPNRLRPETGLDRARRAAAYQAAAKAEAKLQPLAANGEALATVRARARWRRRKALKPRKQK